MNGWEWRCSVSVSVVTLLIGAGVRQWTSQDSKWTTYDSSQSETLGALRAKGDWRRYGERATVTEGQFTHVTGWEDGIG